MPGSAARRRARCVPQRASRAAASSSVRPCRSSDSSAAMTSSTRWRYAILASGLLRMACRRHARDVTAWRFSASGLGLSALGRESRVQSPEPNEMKKNWPELPYAAWQDTYATLHMWMQIVGKVALARAAPLNHGWGIAFHLTPHGLRTGLLTYEGRAFTMTFDFLDHQLVIERRTVCAGRCRSRRERWRPSIEK